MNLPANVRLLRFGNTEIWLDPAAALYLPDYATLVVADLHLAKGSGLRQQGILLPLYDSQDTLARLEKLIAGYRPAQVILLGDSFHDRQGWDRLPAIEQTRLLGLVAQVDTWHWVAGNHDPSLDTVLPGEHATRVQLGEIHFSHQPIDGLRPLVIGHYHPKTTQRIGGVKIKGKAFVHDSELLIMPAFGSYTGGLDLADAVYRNLLPCPQTWVIHQDRVWRV